MRQKENTRQDLNLERCFDAFDLLENGISGCLQFDDVGRLIGDLDCAADVIRGFVFFRMLKEDVTQNVLLEIFQGVIQMLHEHQQFTVLDQSPEALDQGGNSDKVTCSSLHTTALEFNIIKYVRHWKTIANQKPPAKQTANANKNLSKQTNEQTQ